MQPLGLAPNTQPRILCLGAHSDDIEIGCGGTLLRLIGEYPGLQIDWVVLSSDAQREAEARASAEAFLGQVRQKRIAVERFRDGFFPASVAEIKPYFERLKDARPDLIFTHYRHDLHQDHRVVCELTWNTFRDHMILEYEIPKYDGDMGAPNVFVPLSRALGQAKVQHLMGHFASQRSKRWFTDDTFLGLMRLRSIESGTQEHYAEAFYGRKLIFAMRQPHES